MPAATNSTVLITGAGRRIGRAIALAMAADGWRVAVHYNSSSGDADKTVDEITAAGGTAASLQADLEDLEATGDLVTACTDTLGMPVCLINNASLFEPDDLETVTPESFSRHMKINLRSPVFLSQAFAERLPADVSGNIINILDQRVWKLTPDFFSYTLSKSALWTATRTMAQALAPRIRVNAIGPGPTLANERQDTALFEQQQQAVPLERGAALDEFGAAIRFILDAPSMTGQMIALDGGQHLAWRTPDVEADR
ncbi:MAG: SDR family oxidoreductase [Pirellulales bacterium]|nr:SDR family oxidoreductase [Pirellulales bacterium]